MKTPDTFLTILAISMIVFMIGIMTLGKGSDFGEDTMRDIMVIVFGFMTLVAIGVAGSTVFN